MGGLRTKPIVLYQPELLVKRSHDQHENMFIQVGGAREGSPSPNTCSKSVKIPSVPQSSAPLVSLRILRETHSVEFIRKAQPQVCACLTSRHLVKSTCSHLPKDTAHSCMWGSPGPSWTSQLSGFAGSIRPLQQPKGASPSLCMRGRTLPGNKLDESCCLWTALPTLNTYFRQHVTDSQKRAQYCTMALKHAAHPLPWATAPKHTGLWAPTVRTLSSPGIYTQPQWVRSPKCRKKQANI